MAKFTCLAMLMSLFVCSTNSLISDWMYSVGFLLISFLIFRIIDDIGSIHIDRDEHPDRTYLSKENLPKLLTFGGIALGIYLAGLGMFSLPILATMGAFISVSIVLYLGFGKNTRIMPIIPLLKYPILLWCLSNLATDLETITLAISTFFLMASHDLVERIGTKNTRIWASLLVLSITGILIFYPSNNPLNVLYTLPVLILISVVGKWKSAKYIALLYFPITHFLLNSFV